MPGPGPTAHQVLVYSGPGVSPLSLSHTLLTLSLHLLPHYTVQPVSASLLSSEPWEEHCALLVIPGGRDLPYVEELSLKTKATTRIADYVRDGGRYLGLCAGAYFASAEVRFDVGGTKEVTGKRALAFFPGTCAGPTHAGFDYGSESGAKAVSLIARDKVLDLIYYNGGGHFIMPAPLPGVQVVARYAEPPSPDADIAAVQITRGKGKALLLSVHPEYPLEDPPARDAISKLPDPPTEEVVEVAEKGRVEWFADLLAGLGLHIPSREEERAGEEEHLLLHPTHPSPIFVLSHPKLPQVAAGVLDAKNIQAKLKPTSEDSKTLRDGNDEVEVRSVDAVPDVASFLAKRRLTEPEYPPAIGELSLGDSTPAAKAPDMHSLTKTLLLPGAKEYNASWTPLFNFDTYWTELDAARKRSGRATGIMREGPSGSRPALGDLMLYGEAVTSTQTMLDRNPVLLAGLPSPLSFLASFQLSGRGRGSNAWLSPAGCLQWSMLLTLPASMVSKMVLIQYLTALAVAEAVDEDGRLGVRIKWPNDIYAQAEGIGGTEIGSGKKGIVKIGGILVNTNFINGQWRIVVGTGLNVLNALPTTSLSQLHDLLTERAARSGSTKALPPPPTMEGTLARIMNAFEAKWVQFVEAGSFQPFMAEYHARWLHSNQEVTLTTVTPHQRLRIVGITPDYGLMRCVPVTASSSIFGREVGNTEYVELQPDGNSFDLMAGMIKKKV
ncbi:uncharacterized protein CcaverHIS019_0100680 [Cutaneotrichosporon cavernicola]|uniref:BPL/LPL catalytic domain-containing protein n=1 Tax=Cutaneotrichosporon cavernicola TaxID=279322 RepID=A0AA48KZU2_9TREE|nr:uncharacterized protein CcaverHIS019_0100680 [Cutaneotrichosporon cavernicola]BEI87350.1 hypothetical protein CcaverHIS019_0100680 [Cutaneotrichosporon cavernicola]BEI95119.1 hypothetical protein CcaverHIS631_0100680 [Cutaneotrichosporon cavernicola]BEJ02893.1 hypothetical protein CcaverHIS641_0100680 [Cutaneotrichosporon cavernicola]